MQDEAIVSSEFFIMAANKQEWNRLSRSGPA